MERPHYFDSLRIVSFVKKGAPSADRGNPMKKIPARIGVITGPTATELLLAAIRREQAKKKKKAKPKGK